MSDWTPDMVIYHHPCQDGMGAALAAWLRWRDAIFVPSNYGDTPPNVAGLNVLIVDFSYKRAELEAMGLLAASIVILDHHKTAAADLEPFRRFADKPERFTLPTITLMIADLQRGSYPVILACFDMERSGAMMTWNFAHPGKPAPELIEAIQDRDLWRFHRPHSEAIATFLRTMPHELTSWAALLEVPFAQLARDAAMMLTYHRALIEMVAKNAESDTIDDVAAVRVNCPYFLASDVGNLLLDRQPDVVAALWTDGNGWRHWSLRSRDDRPDVSAIASKFGGGGHRNSAGFRTPL